MKSCNNNEIPDGEYLHYGTYKGGEKTADQYFVSRRISNAQGGFFYRIYFDIINISDHKKPPADYAKWPAYLIADPKKAQVIESEGSFSPLDSKNWSSIGGSGIVYWHYLLNREKWVMEYTSKNEKDNVVFSKNYRINIKRDFPLFDLFSINFLACRLIDPSGGGYMYWIIPKLLKEPLAVSARIDKKEVITTGAGAFRVIKIDLLLGDPFISRLAESLLKSHGYYVEDSNRKLVIKELIPGGFSILEDITNVIQ